MEPMLSAAMSALEERLLTRVTAFESRSEAHFAELRGRLLDGVPPSPANRHSGASSRGVHWAEGSGSLLSGAAAYWGTRAAESGSPEPGPPETARPANSSTASSSSRAWRPVGHAMSAEEREEVQLMDTLIDGDTGVQTALREIRDKCERRALSGFTKRERRGGHLAMAGAATTSLRKRSPGRQSGTLDRPSPLIKQGGSKSLLDESTLQSGAPRRPRGDGVRRVCTWMLGPVIHPEGRFRSLWNVLLALLILYCGISVPLEIAMEKGERRRAHGHVAAAPPLLLPVGSVESRAAHAC